MKKLIIFFVLFAAPRMFGAISEVTGAECTAAAASCSLGTHTFGDVEVTCSTRASNTAASLPTGYTNISSAGANTWSQRCAYRFLNGTETSTGTFTNGTRTTATVWRGAGIIASGPKGATPGLANATTTTTLTYAGTNGGTGTTQSLVFSDTSGASTLVAFGSCSACTAGNVAPTGLTLNSGISVTGLSVSVGSGLSAFTTKTVTVTTSGVVRSQVIEIIGSPNRTAITSNDYLVYQKAFRAANEGCTGSCAVTVPLGHTSGAGNYLDVNFVWGYATVAPTVSNVYCNSDTGHATWTWTLTSDGTHNATNLDTGDTTDQFDYHVTNATAGCTSVTIVPSSAWTNFAVTYREFRQIATTSPVDSVAAQTSTTDPFQTAGAVTTSQSNDLIYQDCSSATMGGITGGGAVTNIFNSAGVAVLSGFPFFNLASEAFIYGSTGATTDTIAFLPAAGNHAVCTAVALKTSPGAGIAPTGVQIVSDTNYFMNGTNPNSEQVAIFGSGNTILLLDDGNQVANAVQFTGLTDTLGNTWAIKAPHDASAGYPNLAFDCNATAGVGWFTYTGVNTGATHNHWYIEIRGVDNSSHTACWDTTTGHGGCTPGTCVDGTPTSIVAGTTTPTGLPSITPGTANGIVIANSEIGIGTPISLSSPTCGVFDNDTYPGQTDQSGMGLGNFLGHCLVGSTSTQSWNWTNGTSETYQGIGIHFKTAAAGSSNRRRAIVIQQ